jgi:hypothetical protein
MTIAEATQQGIARLTRPEWSWTEWIELQLLEQEGKRYHGPWCKVVSVPHVEQVLVSAVDQGGYAPWELPAGQHLDESWLRP